MKSQYDYDIIRDYLLGLVEHDRAQEIGALIKKDEIARTIAEGILRLEQDFAGNENEIELYLENFRQLQLKKLNSEINPVKKTKILWYKIAASLLILVTVSFIIRLLINNPDAGSLTDQELAQPYPISTVFRSQRDASASERGFELYAARKYSMAAQYFDQAIVPESDRGTVAFYNALSHLYSGNYDRAIQLLESDIITESRFVQQARWYLSLAYIKSGRAEKAIHVLSIIKKDPHHFKHDNAIQLLDALE